PACHRQPIPCLSDPFTGHRAAIGPHLHRLEVFMDLRKIKKLIDLLEASDLAELEIKEGEEVVRLSRATQTTAVAPAPVAQAAPRCASRAPASPPDVATADGPAGAGHDPPVGPQVKSAMGGSFYVSATAGGDAFVKVGQQVKQGDTLGIIEAMKMFNQIEAE